MTFCNKCGTQVNDGANVCPCCGTAIEEVAQQQAQTSYQRSEADSALDAQQNKTMSILAYIIFFIPLITGDHKKSPFVKFHANQGLVLFLGCIAFGIVYWILSAILVSLLFSAASLSVWGILTTILGLLWLVPAIFCILGIVHAAKGEMKPLPLIGKFKILK